MIARKPIYSTRIAVGDARREGRQPSHDAEYWTLYWDDDRDWMLEDNAGLVTTVHNDSCTVIAEDADSSLDPEHYDELVAEAREIDAEIAKAIREPGELAASCGAAAGDTMIEWGWCEDDEDEDRHRISPATHCGWRIQTGFLEGNLFSDTTGIDEAASVGRYAKLLEKRVQAEYPGAFVKIRIEAAQGVEPRNLHSAAAPDAMDWEEAYPIEEEIIERVNEIGQEVWEDFDAWIVDAEEAPADA